MLRSYWDQSRAPRYSLLFALPLFLFYQTLVALQPLGPSGSEWRNGADVMLQQLFISVAGRRGPLVFLLVLTIVGIGLVIRDLRSHPGRLSARVFPIMLGEALVLALATGVIVGGLTSHIVQATASLSIGQGGGGIADRLSGSTKLMLALGAGLYEELLFRVLLVGLLAAAGRVVFGWRAQTAGGFAVAVGAVIFSAFHYVGPTGDPLTAYSFLFRTLAGVFFSALYLLRGFGITAWTHALYDVFVLLF